MRTFNPFPRKKRFQPNVNEIFFDSNHNKKIKCVKSNMTQLCENCFYEIMKCSKLECSAYNRFDKTEVYFIEVK